MREKGERWKSFARIYKLLFADFCQLFALGRISISFCQPLVFGLGRPRGAAIVAIKAGRAAAEQGKVKAKQQQSRAKLSKGKAKAEQQQQQQDKRAAAFHKWQTEKSKIF